MPTALFLGVTSLGSAQPNPNPQPPGPIDYATARFERTLRSARTTSPVVLDGRLDEDAWQRAEPATNFIQVQPRTGQPATDQTQVRVLYDDVNLYLGARYYDSDAARSRINTLEEDFESNNTDMFGFVLDSLNDRVSGFELFNAVRRTRRNKQDSTWSPLPLRIRSSTRTSWAGMLTGLEGIRQGRNLKIKPFVIGSVRTFGSTGSDVDGDAGIDLNYGVSPSLTLDLIYRTDFSQVEADEQQVNLTRFNIQCPEKREFFLENQGVFNIAATLGDPPNIVPFSSRRIGLSEDGTPIPIVGGARLSGRASDYDVGVMTLKTEDFGALPSDNFLVGRVRRNLPNTSTVGAIVTSRDAAGSGNSNRVI